MRLPIGFGRGQKLLRRFVLLWAIALNTWVVYTVFTDPPDISGATAAALGSVITILTAIIGFYQYLRDKDEHPCPGP